MSDLPPEQKEKLYKARIAELVRKFTAGKRLTDGELAEIEAIIPARVLRAHAKKLRGRDVYDRPRAYYAELYGCTVKSINNWTKHGLSRNAPPPLDDPAEMVAWWGKNMEHRVPDKIYEAERRARPAQPESDPVAAPPERAAAPPPLFDRVPHTPPPAEDVPLSTGFLASLVRTREEEAQAHRRYREAIEDNEPNEGKIRVTQKTWQDLADHLRALEKAAPDVLRKSGDMWMSVDIVRELADIHGPIVDGARTLGRRFAVKAGLDWTVPFDRIFQEECDRLFQRLIESRFAAHE